MSGRGSRKKEGQQDLCVKREGEEELRTGRKRNAAREEAITRYLLCGFTPEKPPDPERREAFLRHLPVERRDRISLPSMVIGQLWYLKKGTYLAAILFFLASLAVVPSLRENAVWALSACTPLLALAAELEVSRSFRFGMAELESTTRFSLKSIVYARFLLAGLLYLLVMGLASILIYQTGQMRILLALSYLLLPYLVTMTGALLLERSSYGRRVPYASASFSVLASVGVLLAKHLDLLILSIGYGWIWELGSFLFLIALCVLFSYQVKTREVVAGWNS